VDSPPTILDGTSVDLDGAGSESSIAMKRAAPILLGVIGTCLQTFARGILIGVDQLDYRDGLAVRISDLYNVSEVSCEHALQQCQTSA
jgi:hypothetical protein